MKTLKPTKTVNPYARKIVTPVRLNASEMKIILSRAVAFTKGNVSEFLRYAALNFEPKKEDFRK